MGNTLGYKNGDEMVFYDEVYRVSIYKYFWAYLVL